MKAVVFYLLLLVLFFPDIGHSADIKAFILHSYHQEYPWTRQENRGIVNTLEKLTPENDLTISTEYLDTKRVRLTEEYKTFYSEYLRKKYDGFTPDILFASDDDSLQFMLEFRSKIFPDVPLVFCGVNDTSVAETIQETDIYGVFEVKDITANLQLFKKLFPDIEEVTFIGDDSGTYKAIHNQILSAAALDFPDYDLAFFAHRKFQQVENLIKAIPGKIIVLTTIGGFTDDNSQILPIGSVIRRLRGLGDFAIISMEDVYMMEGVLGGIVTSGEEQGRAAAVLAMQTLEGKSKENHQRFVNGANVPTFDHHELHRLYLPKTRLPADFIILNEPLSIYEEFRAVIISSLIAITILCMLIFFLLVSVNRRKKAEQDLKESRNFLTSVLDNLPDIVFVKDAEQLRFVRLNKAGEEIFEEKAENIIGKNDYDFFPSDDADHYTAKDRETLNKKQLVDIPIESIMTSSGKRYLHTKKIPILDSAGTPLFLLGISRDITQERIAAQERTELENKLQQAQKMQSIGTLAGGIAHDFNNILSSIIGYTELAQHQHDAPESVKKLLEGTLKGTERAKQLVRQILTFSRKNDQQKLPVILADIIQESLSLLKSTLPSTISIKDEMHTAQKVLADPTQMHQVVMNLCTNGYHAMEETGGLLVVNLAETEINDPADALVPQMKPGRYLHLAVTDSGKGMKDEIIDRIFDPYFTTKGPEAGTGLGLAVVHGIIQSHDGYIGVASEVSGGTTISVFLPVFEANDLDTPGVPTQEIKTYRSEMGESILLVDDEPDIVDLTETYLTTYGYRVTSFTDSEKAIKEYGSNWQDYDLVITDMTMPNIAGDELSRKMLAVNPLARIILCTGYSSTLNKEKALKLGISAYCEKPVSIDELLKVIYKVLISR